MAVPADGIISAFCYEQRNFRLFLFTGRAAISILDQVIRIRCGIERRRRGRRIGTFPRQLHLNKEVTSFVSIRGVEINRQFAICYRKKTVIHRGKRASFRSGCPCSFFILEIGIIRLGERYFELRLTPRLILFGGIEGQCLDLTAYRDGFELVSQVDGLHRLSLRVNVVAIHGEMALCGISAVVNCDCLIGTHIRAEQCCCDK